MEAQGAVNFQDHWWYSFYGFGWNIFGFHEISHGLSPKLSRLCAETNFSSLKCIKVGVQWEIDWFDLKGFTDSQFTLSQYWCLGTYVVRSKTAFVAPEFSRYSKIGWTSSDWFSHNLSVLIFHLFYVNINVRCPDEVPDDDKYNLGLSLVLDIVADFKMSLRISLHLQLVQWRIQYPQVQKKKRKRIMKKMPTKDLLLNVWIPHWDGFSLHWKIPLDDQKACSSNS